MTPSHDTPGLDGILNSYPDVDRHSCQLLGPTALIVQGLMGIFVLLSLVYKRHREASKRPWRIWLFDVSKQVVGQMFVHSANVVVSGLASHHTSGNACVSYILNILIDTTFGVALIYVILHMLTHLFTKRLSLKGFESGVYGNPPSIKFWASQAALYVLSLLMMKVIVITILILFPGIYVAGEWLLSWTWTDEGDALQVVFTMGIFPIIMNIVQFWLIDSIVKASAATTVAQDIESTHQDREPLFRADDDGQPPRLETENRGSSRCSVSSLDSQDLEPHANTSYQTTTVTPDEHKSGASSSRHPVDAYSYPPSLSSSISSDRSSILNHHKSPKSINYLGGNGQCRDRSPAQRPANSSSKTFPLVPRTPSPRFSAFVVAQDYDVWEDTDDWNKDHEHIGAISKQPVLSTNGSRRNAHTIEPMGSQQYLRSD